MMSINSDDHKKVFVVHGRNKSIEKAMFTFLTTLGLHPLNWEENVRFTGSGSPDTLDVVRTGMENSYCVIVLLTGDDVAYLRREYGEDSPMSQARPNVILEAGMALSLKRKETILVRFGDVRKISDIEGLNYITIDNSQKTRRNLAKRLQSIGCKINVSTKKHLNKETGGDFDIKQYNEDEDRPLKAKSCFIPIVDYAKSDEVRKKIYKEAKEIAETSAAGVFYSLFLNNPEKIKHKDFFNIIKKQVKDERLTFKRIITDWGTVKVGAQKKLKEFNSKYYQAYIDEQLSELYQGGKRQLEEILYNGILYRHIDKKIYRGYLSICFTDDYGLGLYTENQEMVNALISRFDRYSANITNLKKS